MRKDVSNKRDGFTLSIQNPAPDKRNMLFIPVRLPSALQEHWVTRFIVAPDEGEEGGTITPTIALMPVTEINFNFEGNWLNYGSTALPKVTTVSFAPYETPFQEADLNVKTAAELLAIPNITQEKLDAAVIDYLIRNNNTIGGPMLQTMPIINTMNSFPQKTYRL